MVADLIEQKVDVISLKTLDNSPVQEYIGQGIERMLLIVKDNVKIILKDQTRIVVPKAMREVILQRENGLHSGQNKMSNIIRVEYFWPGIEGDVKNTVEASMDKASRGSPTAAEEVVCHLWCGKVLEK